MKAYLRTLMLFSLLILGSISLKGVSCNNSQIVSNDGTAQTCCYELSGCSKTLNSLSCSEKGLEDESFHYYAGCSSMEIVEQSLTSNSFFNQLRFRKGVDLSGFFKTVMHNLSIRDKMLLQDKIKTFYSCVNHKGSPSCEYYIFALRRIII